MDLLSCSTDLLPYHFLNIYSRFKLPSLLVSILYWILTSSILPSSWDTSTSTSWTAWSFLLQHTFLKWPNFLQLVHIFPYARHCLSACTDPQYLYGQCGDALCVTLYAASYFATFTWSNLWESVMSLRITACILCASTVLAQISMSSLVIWSHCYFLLWALWLPHLASFSCLGHGWTVLLAGSLCLYSCILLLLLVTSLPIPQCFPPHVYIIVWIAGIWLSHYIEA